MLPIQLCFELLEAKVPWVASSLWRPARPGPGGLCCRLLNLVCCRLFSQIVLAVPVQRTSMSSSMFWIRNLAHQQCRGALKVDAKILAEKFLDGRVVPCHRPLKSPGTGDVGPRKCCFQGSALGRSVSGRARRVFFYTKLELHRVPVHARSFLGFFRLTSRPFHVQEAMPCNAWLHRLRKPQMPMLPQSAFSKASQAQVRTALKGPSGCGSVLRKEATADLLRCLAVDEGKALALRYLRNPHTHTHTRTRQVGSPALCSAP